MIERRAGWKKAAQAAAAAGLLLLCAGCTAGVSVRSTFDQSAHFEDYKTFAMMLPNKAVATENVNVSPFVMQRLRQMTHAELSSRGYEFTSKDQAQILVAVLAGTERRVDAMDTPGYAGYGYVGPGWTYSVDEYVEGTVVIDLVDSKTNAVVWRGAGKTRVDEHMEDSELRGVIAAILAEYPPGGKVATETPASVEASAEPPAEAPKSEADGAAQP